MGSTFTGKENDWTLETQGVTLRSWGKRGTQPRFPGGSEVKASASNAETRGRSLGGEDPLEKEMAIHSSILAWRIPWMEKRSRLQSMGLQRVGHD